MAHVCTPECTDRLQKAEIEDLRRKVEHLYPENERQKKQIIRLTQENNALTAKLARLGYLP